MWMVISVCFLVLTSLIGITELLRQLWLFVLRPKEDPPRMLVVFLQSGIAVSQIRSAMEYLSWEREESISGIVAVTDRLAVSEKEEIRQVIKALPQVVLVDGNVFQE